MTPATPSVGFTVHHCVDCRFHRMRAEPELFGSAELKTPGGLKAQSEWMQMLSNMSQMQYQSMMTVAKNMTY
jgi:hypothetical protein